MSKDHDLRSSSSDSDEAERPSVSEDKTIILSQDELKVMEDVKAKQEKDSKKAAPHGLQNALHSALHTGLQSPVKEEDDGSDAEVLKDILHLPKDLLDADIVNTIMNDDDTTKNGDNLEELAGEYLPTITAISYSTNISGLELPFKEANVSYAF